MRTLATVVLLAVLPAAMASQTPARRIDEYLTARAKLGQFNGSVLVAERGRVLLDSGYGFANVEHRVRAGASTRYAIASITKNFTAAAILRLQERGALSTADSLCHWITPCADAWRPVTLTQMLHHTSGIPDYEEPLDLGSTAYMDYMGQSRSAARIVEQARTKPLDFPPGSKFKYSNTAYILLGMVIEKASGTTFNAFLRSAVLAPARLTDMHFVSVGEVVPHMAAGYHRADLDFAAVQAGVALDEHTLVREALIPLDGPHADGNLIATARDLWRWTESLADSTGLAPASLREMLTPGLAGYGTGWFIGERFGRRTASHTGSLPGYASVMEWYPDSRSLIVLLSNTTGVRQSIILRDIAAMIAGRPYDLPVARRLIAYDSAAARQLAGDYLLEDGGHAIVTPDKTMLSVEVPGRFTAGAFPVNASEYYAPFFDNTVRFERDGAGVARRIMLRINGATLAGTRQP